VLLDGIVHQVEGVAGNGDYPYAYYIVCEAEAIQVPPKTEVHPHEGSVTCLGCAAETVPPIPTKETP